MRVVLDDIPRSDWERAAHFAQKFDMERPDESFALVSGNSFSPTMHIKRTKAGLVVRLAKGS